MNDRQRENNRMRKASVEILTMTFSHISLQLAHRRQEVLLNNNLQRAARDKSIEAQTSSF